MDRGLSAMVLVAACALWGCAGQMDALSDLLRTGPWWQASQTAHLLSLARALEAEGELSAALDHLRLVQRITVDPEKAEREISRLNAKINAAVQSHYQLGLTALKEKRLSVARNHFLAALRLDPDFHPALDQIRTHFSSFPLAVYQAVAGDAPSTVAKAVFNDENKAFLVAWFNDVPPDQALAPGTVLILPKLQKPTPAIIHHDQGLDRLAEARARLAENDFAGALALAEAADATDPDVLGLVHAIHVKQALAHITSKRLEEARHVLAAVPDGFTGKATALERLQAAENDRQLAVAREHFSQHRYQACLDLIDPILENTPDNREVRNLAAEARYRLAQDHVDHQRFLDARQVLEQADEDHAAGAALKKTVQARLNETAQIHYRNGVKHFINEDLTSAIAEWEKALVCNPNHEKARENIDNARRLLQKIETIP